MSILVLGGAGYIGSHAVRELIAAGRDVVVADNLVTGFAASVHPRARFYQLDIRDRAALDALFEREDIEGVLHFAAFSQVGESMSKPLKYYGNNLGGTMTLLESMVAHGVGNINTRSSVAVYGEPERVPILESDPTVPTNCYGQTKLAMEQMMAWVARAHGLRYTALRYFNASGADPSGENRRGPRPGDPPHTPCFAGPAGEARAHLHLRRRLPDGGRHLRARLHPRHGPGRGAHPRARLPARRRGERRFQPRQRRGLFR